MRASPGGSMGRPRLPARTRTAAAVLAALVLTGASGCAGSLPDADEGAVVTFAVTRASGGNMAGIIEDFNEANPDARVRLVYLAADADAQRTAMVQEIGRASGRERVRSSEVGGLITNIE